MTANEPDFIKFSLSQGNVSIHIDSVDKIKWVDRPRTKGEVRSHISLTNCYRKYSPNFTWITTLLRDLHQKEKAN